jgi:hypothetical protein
MTMNPIRQSALIVLLGVCVVLPMPAAQGQTVETGIVKLADSNIEYFSRGEGQPIVLLPGGTLTVGYLDGLADALANAGYRVVGINFRGSGKSTGVSILQLTKADFRQTLPARPTTLVTAGTDLMVYEWLRSAQKQTFAPQKVMSALPPKADMCGATRHVRYGP